MIQTRGLGAVYGEEWGQGHCQQSHKQVWGVRCSSGSPVSNIRVYNCGSGSVCIWENVSKRRYLERVPLGDRNVEVAGDHVSVEWCASVGSYRERQEGIAGGLAVWIRGWGLWLAVLMGLQDGEGTQRCWGRR